MGGHLYGADGGYDVGIVVDPNDAFTSGNVDRIDNLASVRFKVSSTLRDVTLADFAGVDFAVRLENVGTDIDADSDGDGTGTWKITNLVPSITIDKVTGDGPEGLIIDDDYIELAAGVDVVWTYTITNTGDYDLSDIAVWDSDGSVTPILDPDSDIGGDGILSVGESWTYTATGTTIAHGEYTNFGYVSGFFEGVEAIAQDESGYFVPGGNTDGPIHVEKSVQDITDSAGMPLQDGGIILVGHEILWTYTVTNTGLGSLSDILVEDSVLSILYDRANGLADGVTFEGDDNHDEFLQPTETWIFTIAGFAEAGPYSNTVFVSGSDDGVVSEATATSTYFGAAPSLIIDKTTQDTTDLAGDTLDDAGIILVGHSILWSYEVTNTGNVTLTNIDVVDDMGTVEEIDDVLVGTIAELAAGDSATLTFTGTAIADAYSNIATAKTTYEDTAGHTAMVDASDTSSYFGANPHLTLDKKTQDLAVPLGTPGDGITVLTGEAIRWVYVVKNDGNVELSNVVVTDDNGTSGTSDDVIVGTIASLGAGASTTFELAARKAPAGAHEQRHGDGGCRFRHSRPYGRS